MAVRREMRSMLEESSLGTAQNLMSLIDDLTARVEALERQAMANTDPPA